jgi:hypothetical protein
MLDSDGAVTYVTAERKISINNCSIRGLIDRTNTAATAILNSMTLLGAIGQSRAMMSLWLNPQRFYFLLYFRPLTVNQY